MPDYTQRFPSGTFEHGSADNGKASLDASINSSAVTIILTNDQSDDAYSNFPEGIGANQPPFIVTIENEKILISRRVGATLTVYDEDDEGLGYLSAGLTGRGYDGSTPASHTIITSIQCYLYVTSRQNEEIRDAISALETNKPDSGEVMLLTGANPMSDDLDLGGNVLLNSDILELVERVGTPANEAGKGKLYGADVDGVTDLHWLDDSGQAVRITTNGEISASSGLSFLGNGADGALSITSGTTNINANQLYQYTSISITGTGKLSTASDDGIMMIACQGNCTVSAASGIDFSEKSLRTNSIAYTLISGVVINYIAPANGGSGGAGAQSGGGSNSAGGALSVGYGGGGGGGTRGAVAGGVGGAGGTPCGNGGAGGVGAGDAGAAGGISAGGGGAGDLGGLGGGVTHGTAGAAAGAGGGGAGGRPGYGGLPGFLNVGGNANFTGGGINCKGGNAQIGGAGGNGSSAGGGGGGGGGGGNAADFLLRYVGTYTAGTNTFANGVKGGTALAGTGGTGAQNGFGGTDGAGSGALSTAKIVPQL